MRRDILVGVALALATALPVAWKWQLGMRSTVTAVGALGLMASMVVAPAAVLLSLGTWARTGLAWFTTLGLAAVALAYRFFRDPERCPPNDNRVIVSPADGKVLYVRESQGGTLPASTKDGRRYPLHELTRTPLRTQDAVVIGIGMSFLDVHVNRVPIAGRVTLRQHFAGRFGSLRRPEMVFLNERATTVVEQDDLQVAVVQIASRLVRRIVSFVREGEDVALGQRLGMIRLGSQVDLVLPARPDLQVAVRAGDRVTAAETIVATLRHVRAPVAGPCETRQHTGERSSDSGSG